MNALTITLTGAVLAFPMAAWATGPPTSRGLARCFMEAAPEVISRIKKYGHVGVLRFRVARGKGALLANAGAINQELADRLEGALIARLPADETVCLIRDASETAARLKGASHLTKEGRAVLFTGRYRPWWGKSKDPVRADAFLAGEARISADLQQVTVTISCFDKSSKDLEEVASFTADTDPAILLAGGESFINRAGLRGSVGVRKIKKDREADPHPLAPKADPPIRLDIYYGDSRTPVPLEFYRGPDGREVARVPEPAAGKKVKLVLTRNDTGEERLGVVLKVNGLNTAFKETLPDARCTKWILEPKAGPVPINGFQRRGDDKAEAFVVLSRKESAENVRLYGPDPGTITMAVFREKRGEPGKKPTAVAGSIRESPAEDVAPNVDALRYRLGTQWGRGTVRGMIGAGGDVASKVKQVPFTTDPDPVMAITIEYYRP